MKKSSKKTIAKNDHVPAKSQTSAKTTTLPTKSSVSSSPSSSSKTTTLPTISTKSSVSSSPSSSSKTTTLPTISTKSSVSSSPSSSSKTTTLPTISTKSSVSFSLSSSSSVIAYVHSLSPVKRNKKNTLDYLTLSLQTSENPSQKALLYSQNKRPLLLESEQTHTPVKLSRFTYTKDHDKIIINDMTKVSFANQHEYSFQYQEQANDCSKPTTIKDIVSACSQWDYVTLYAKAILINNPNVVGSNLRVAESFFADNTGTIQVDVWEDNISSVEVGNVYKISPVQVRVWDNTKKLSTTLSTVVTPIPDEQCFKEVQVPREDLESLSHTAVVVVPKIHIINQVEMLIQCVKCSKKILQETAKKIVKCDRCSSAMRISDCKRQLCVKLVVLSVEEKDEINLTIFEDVLQNVLVVDLKSLSEDEIIEVLLVLENLTITYNTRSMVITHLSQASSVVS